MSPPCWYTDLGYGYVVAYWLTPWNGNYPTVPVDSAGVRAPDQTPEPGILMSIDAVLKGDRTRLTR